MAKVDQLWDRPISVKTGIEELKESKQHNKTTNNRTNASIGNSQKINASPR